MFLIQNFLNQIQCSCSKGFYGKFCQFENCVMCNPVYGECVNGECQCITRNKGGKFCNETICDNEYPDCFNGGLYFFKLGKCSVYKNELICICDSQMYTGLRCEKKCESPCKYGICVSLKVCFSIKY